MRHEREAQILRHIAEQAEQSNNPLNSKDLQSIYREIIASCRSLESPLQIAYLGPSGTYSEAAARKYFGQSDNIHFIPQRDIANIFEEIENERASYGLVPIENSYEGYVSSGIDGLIAMQKGRICAEVRMHINHSFLSKCESIDTVEKLYTHQQSYAQCSQWLQKHLHRWQVEFVPSNGLAAKLASENPKSAAIASQQAAQQYQLNELQQKIQNQSSNITRFLVIGNHSVEPSGLDASTLVFALNNEAGALQKALNILAEKNINITQIVSRPNRSSDWGYLFLIDIAGHQKEAVVAQGIEKLQQHVPMLKLLGSYPISPTIS